VDGQPIERTHSHLISLFGFLALEGCSSLYPVVEDPVEWWAINGWDSNVTIELYDNNCERPLRDIRLKPKQQVKVISCGDGSGRANIRYRREGYSVRQPSWGPDTLLRSNQNAVVR